jgi:AcrR family transcriptional regulator
MRVLWEAMASSNDPMERLYRGIDAYLAFAEEHPDGFRLLLAAAAAVDQPAGGRLREVRESIARGLSNTIADVMRGAGLGTEGAPIYAHALLGGAESVVAWWLEAKRPDRATVTDHLLAFAWRGFDGLPRDPTRLHRQRAEHGTTGRAAPTPVQLLAEGDGVPAELGVRGMGDESLNR